jgi:HEAT repeat protein
VAVPRLTEALKKPGMAAHAAYILGQLGPTAAPATEALVELIDGKNTTARQEALIALAKIGPNAKAAVPALVKALEQHADREAFGAVYALGRIGPAAVSAKPALLKAVEDKDESLALVSAWALARIEPQSAECAKKTVPVLIKGLGDSEPQFRLGAVEALGQLGALAKNAKTALETAAAKDADANVRKAAADAVTAIGGGKP